MPEVAPDFDKMMQEEIDKLGGPSREDEQALLGVEGKTTEEVASEIVQDVGDRLKESGKAKARAKKKEEEMSRQAAIQEVRKGLGLPEGKTQEAIEPTDSAASDKPAETEEPYAEENAELLNRAEEMKKSLGAGQVRSCLHVDAKAFGLFPGGLARDAMRRNPTVMNG